MARVATNKRWVKISETYTKKPRLLNILQTNWSILLKNVRIRNDKEKLRNHSRLKESKTTWQVRATCDPELHSALYKEILWRKLSRLGTVAHSCNPHHSGMPRWADQVRSEVQDQPGQRGETPRVLKIEEEKKKERKRNISQARWPATVLPATQKAEAWESLHPQTVGCSKPTSYYCTPAWATQWDSLSINQSMQVSE